MDKERKGVEGQEAVLKAKGVEGQAVLKANRATVLKSNRASEVLI